MELTKWGKYSKSEIFLLVKIVGLVLNTGFSCPLSLCFLYSFHCSSLYINEYIHLFIIKSDLSFLKTKVKVQ